MADVSSIAQALTYCCAQAVYPNGMTAASVTGRAVVIRRGWLLPSDLVSAQSVRGNSDYVTVTAAPLGYRTVPEPLGRPWRDAVFVAPTVQAVVSGGRSVAFSVPQDGSAVGIVGVRYCPVGGAPCVASYAVSSGDTSLSVSMALCRELGVGAISGSGFSVSAGVLSVSVVGYGKSVQILRRQQQRFHVSIWSSSAVARDALASVLDEFLAEKTWLATLDGAQALMSFSGGCDVDTMQVQSLYRRDLEFEVVFDTTRTQVSGQMMFGSGTIGLDGRVFHAFGDMSVTVPDDVATAALAAETAIFGNAISAYPGLTMDGFGTVTAVSAG